MSRQLRNIWELLQLQYDNEGDDDEEILPIAIDDATISEHDGGE